MATQSEKWRGILGGLEERKSAFDIDDDRPHPSKRTLSVRPVPGGYAVFGERGEKLSEVFARRADAVGEAEAYAGGDGDILLAGPTGHVESEAMLRRGG